jgi:hypothetical protein
MTTSRNFIVVFVASAARVFRFVRPAMRSSIIAVRRKTPSLTYLELKGTCRSVNACTSNAASQEKRKRLRPRTTYLENCIDAEAYLRRLRKLTFREALLVSSVVVQTICAICASRPPS